MDANRISAKIYAGNGKAAKVLGLDYALCRPIDPLAPLSNQIRTIKASFNAQDWSYLKPNGYGKPLWYGVVDGRYTQVGDYLVRTGATYFIAAMQTHLPILCVECNRVITVQRQDVGSFDNNDFVSVAVGAPASILEATQSSGKLDGPIETGQGRYRCLLPSLGIYITTNYTILDDLDQSYNVLSSELTDLGWRLIMERVRT